MTALCCAQNYSYILSKAIFADIDKCGVNSDDVYVCIYFPFGKEKTERCKHIERKVLTHGETNSKHKKKRLLNNTADSRLSGGT